MRILVALSLVLVACHSEPTIVIHFDAIDMSSHADAAQAHDAATTPSAKSECKTNVDCVAVPDSCCDCAHGGKLVAMRMGAQTKRDCSPSLCTMMMSNDPSCAQHAACVQGTCRLTP